MTGSARSGCLDSEEAAGFAYGWLPHTRRARVEEHIASCAACEQRVAELAASIVVPRIATRATIVEGASGSVSLRENDRDDALLPRGTVVVRYIVDGMQGAGAMGVVYGAYDSKLDRKIALKMLRADRPSSRDRLEQEARAMARLSHRNVVAVYDIGIHQGRVFLAMEFIEGITLRSWLTGERRRLYEILQAFLQAGRGLAAAHEKGLVHHDFKPDNVLCERGGRVCVTDFGMAGSPAYMAPEQYLGNAIDERTDQYSFCVSLYEALYHQRPFPDGTWVELSDAVIHGRIRKAPARTTVPLRVQKILWRGLSVDPAKRYASMGDLLAELSDDPSSRTRRIVASVGLLAVLVAASWTYSYVKAKSQPVCQQFERRLEGVWDESRKRAVHDGLLATGSSFAGDAWQGVERSLDAYATRWVAARTEACEATHVHHDQSADLLDRRIACLDDRATEFAALTEVLSHADGQIVVRAMAAAQSLGSPASCANTRELILHAKPPADEATAAKVSALRSDLARAKALREAGKYREGLTLAETVVKAADSLQYRPLLGEALFRCGELYGLTANATDAETSLLRAIAIADAEGDDTTRARAWARLIADVGYAQGKYDRISLFNEQSMAAIARMGGNPEVDGVRRCYLASAWRREGKFDDAIDEYEASIPILEGAFGKAGFEPIRCRDAMADVLRIVGKLDESWQMLRANMEVAEGSLGARHPQIAVELTTLAAVLGERMQPAEAVDYLERAVRIAEDANGPTDPRLVAYVGNLGFALLDVRSYSHAISCFERVLAIREKYQGWGQTGMLHTFAGLGEAYLGLGDRKRAIEHLEHAIRLDAKGEAALDLARARFALGDARWPADRRRSRALVIEARDSYRALGRSPRDVRSLQRIERWLEEHGG